MPSCMIVKSLSVFSDRHIWHGLALSGMQHHAVLLTPTLELYCDLSGAVQYLDGATLKAACALNKPVRTALAKEQHIYSLDKPRFIHGAGVKTLV